MKNAFSKQTVLALAVAAALGLSGCGSSDSNDLPEPVVPTPVDPVIVEDPEVVEEEGPEAPELPDTNTLTIQLNQAVLDSGEAANTQVTLITDENLVLLESNTFTVDESGALTLDLNLDVMLDDDLNGVLDKPFRVELEFSLPGFFTERSQFTIADFGENNTSFELVARDDPALADQGIVSESQEVNLDTLPLDEESGNVVIESTSEEAAVQEVSFAPDVVLLDDTGNPLDTSDVQVEQASIDVNSEELPIEDVETVANIDEVNEALGLDIAPEEADNIEISPAAFVDIAITAGGQDVASIGGSEPLSVVTLLDPNTLNPATGESIKAGDMLPVWSQSEGESGWTYEQTVEVFENEDGLLAAEFSTTHLTRFTLGGASVRSGIQSCIFYGNLRDSVTRQRLLVPGDFAVSWLENGVIKGETVRYQEDGYIYATIPGGSGISQMSFEFLPDDASQALELDILFEYATGIPDFVVTGTKLTFTEVQDCNFGYVYLEYTVPEEISVLPPPRLSANVSNYVTLTEGDNDNSFDITFNSSNISGTDRVVPITFTPIAGSAGVGTDFTFESGATTVTLNDANPSGTFSVNVVGDDVAEARIESFQVEATLSADSEASFSNGGKKQTFTVRVRDDDTLTITSVSAPAVFENEGFATFTLSTDANLPEGDNRVFRYSLGGGANDTATANLDYFDSDGGSATRASGPRNVSASAQNNQFVFTVPIEDDSDFESDEIFTVTLFDTSDVFVAQDARTTEVTIRNDDAEPVDPPTSITLTTTSNSQVSGISMSENQVRNFKLALDKPAVDPITVNLSIGAPVTLDNTSVTFANGEATKLFSLTVPDDRIVESQQTAQLSISAPNGLTLVGADNTSVSISDNDYNFASFDVNQSTYSTVTEGNGQTPSVNYTVTLYDPSNQVVTSVEGGATNVDITASLSGAGATIIGGSSLTLNWPQDNGSIAVEVSDDNVLNRSRWLTLRSAVTASIPPRTYFYGEGRSFFNGTDTATTETMSTNNYFYVVDNDSVTVRGDRASLGGNLDLQSGSGGDNNGVFVNVSKTMNVEVSNDLGESLTVSATISSNDPLVDALIQNKEQLLGFGDGEDLEEVVTIDIPSTDISALELPNNGDTRTATITVTLNPNLESIPSELRGRVTLSVSQFSFEVTYTNNVTSATGAG